MKKEELYELLGEVDESYVKGAEEPMKKEVRPVWTRLGAIAAMLALMLCSGTVGALAFGRERVVEVPAQAETIEMEELGLTLILPDDWKGRYTVVKDTFQPYGTPMWEVCVKMVYGAKTPMIEGEEDLFYRGTLFTVFQCEDHPMSAQEFAEDSGIAGIGRYLFATENATYAILYASDVQFDPDDPAQGEEYTALARSMKEIGVLVNGLVEIQ